MGVQVGIQYMLVHAFKEGGRFKELKFVCLFSR